MTGGIKVGERSIHQILEERIRFLKGEGKEKEILLLLKRFCKAQDLASEAFPLSGAVSLEDMTSVIRSRQRFLLEMMGPFLTERKTVIIMIPISLN